MIVHVFTANRYHLVRIISKGFVTKYKDNASHKFLFYGDKKLDRHKYDSIFKDIGFSEYVFCTSMKEYLSVIRKHKNTPILFHAGSYHWFLMALLIGCKKLNWVCWGSGASSGKRLKARLSLPYKRYLYSRFNSIVTLMDSDRETIIHDFHVDSSKVQTIPYASGGDGKRRDDLFIEEIVKQHKHHDKPVVLLGNNPSCISGYIDMLPRLKQYKGKIIVKCMLNYSLVKDEKYEKLIKLGVSMFGEDFVSSEEFYEDRGDYFRYMDECDIYICPVQRQSGLGAIDTCLRLGKKVFLTGKNYDWIKEEYGSQIYHLDSICSTLSFEEFVEELPDEAKERNFYSIIDKRTGRVEKWRTYLKWLDGK